MYAIRSYYGNLVRDPVLENPPVVDREGGPGISAEYYELERFVTTFTFTTERTTLDSRGNLGKSPLAVVDIQVVAADVVGDKEVEIAVVVDITEA